jgi:hypothetical protein
MSGITADGGFAEYMVTEAKCIVALPDSLSFEQAAPLMCAGVINSPSPQNPPCRSLDIEVVKQTDGSLGYCMECHPSGRSEGR